MMTSYTILKEESHAILEKHPNESFKSIFWQQQLEAASRDKKHVKWHPSMIRWCLYLRHKSSKAYDVVRESGAIALPSQRTLRDYTHHVKAYTGFSVEVDQQLAQAGKLTTCKEHEKLVVLLLDEMHVREDLIYDKHTGSLIGFSNLGETNIHLSTFEKQMQSVEDPEETSSKDHYGIHGLCTFFKAKVPICPVPNCENKGAPTF